MLDKRISEYTALAGASIATGDLIELVDVSDTTDAASGTNKKTTAGDVATAVGTLLSLASTYQPLDSDLTAIAALTTTAFGRALLALADAAALRTAAGTVIGTDVQAYDADLGTIAGLTPTNDDILQRKAGAWTNRTIAQLATDLGLATSYQPLDSDLTAIAALTTTSYGRAFLALADAAAARTAIGVVIGTDVQAYDAELAALAGLTSAADRVPYFTGSGTASLATFTAAGRALVDDADASAQRTTLGLGTVATQASSELVQAANGGKESVNTQATATGATTLNLANGNVFDCTLTGNVTFTLSGSTASVACSFTLIARQDGTGSRTITWPASVKWAAGTAPTISTGASKVDVFTFVTVDNGTTWYGFTGGIDMR